MLVSELEERGRRFKLALRAGIPILLLISINIYAVFFYDKDIELNILDSLLVGAIVFVVVYFIYFLLEQDSKESLIDYETHGFNHNAFKSILKTSHQKTIAMLIIRNIQTINENYGSEQTSKLLYTIVHRLNHSLAEDGLDQIIIGRRFGAEFLVAINEKREDLGSALDRFISQNRILNDIDIFMQYSLVTYSNDEFDKVITRLKDKLISSKNYNKVFSHTKSNEINDVQSSSREEQAVLQAIKDKTLTLSFRPILNIKTDKIDIYEVAVKLRSDQIGDILPRTYLPIVNRLGLGREYDFSIIKHLTKLLPLLDDNVSLTFNISPFSLRNREFQSKFFDHLDRCEVDVSRLIIELYERKVHHDLTNYFQTLNYMRAKGLRVAIDNFGSSNASMEYMKHFKFDMVQFDREYIAKLEDNTTYEILKSLVEMSKNLDIITIAKWVDKDSQKNRIKELGIDYVQGFGIGKPISENELIDNYN